MKGLDSQERRVLEIILEPSFKGLLQLMFYEAAIDRLIAQRRLTLEPCSNCGENHRIAITPDGKEALEIARMLDNASAAPAGW